MKVKTKKTINIVLVVILVILILLLLFLLFAKLSYSKFRNNVSSSGIAEIAQPVLVVDGAEKIKIDGIQDTTYNFSVKNYNSTNISETDLEYSIEIVNDSKADLEFELIKNSNEKIKLNNNKTEFMNLKGITRSTDNYELRIKYKNNVAITEDITGNVQVKVVAVQSEVM